MSSFLDYSTAGQTPNNPLPINSLRNPATTDTISPDGSPFMVGRIWVNRTTKAVFIYAGGGVWNASNSTATTGTNGQLLIGSTGASPAFSTLTLGPGLTQTAGAGTLTLGVQSGGLTPNSVAGTTQQLAIGNSYISNNVALTTFTLPTTAAVGDEIEIIGSGAGFWRLAQNASQLVKFNAAVTTTGVGGSITSTQAANTINIKCTVANTTWTVTNTSGAQGAYTVV
jgi:hypothetical protein